MPINKHKVKLFCCWSRLPNEVWTIKYKKELSHKIVYKNIICFSFSISIFFLLFCRHDIYVYNTKAEDTNENASKVFHKPSNLSLAIFIVYIVLIVTSWTCFMNHLLKKGTKQKKISDIFIYIYKISMKYNNCNFQHTMYENCRCFNITSNTFEMSAAFNKISSYLPNMNFLIALISLKSLRKTSNILITYIFCLG